MSAALTIDPARGLARKSPGRGLLGAYIAGIIAAEAAISWLSVYAGLGLHAAVLCALMAHYARCAGAGGFSEALVAIGLVPVLRILSASLPLAVIEPVYWPGLIGAVLLVGILLAKQRLQLSWADVGMRVQEWPAQALIGLSGAGLGVLGYVALSPLTAVSGTGQQALVASLLLILFGGFTEELLFRGLIQGMLARGGRVFSLVGSSALFAAAYFGAGRVGLTALFAAAGLYFGWCVQRTGSIAGTSMAHALMTLGMFIVWPAVLG